MKLIKSHLNLEGSIAYTIISSLLWYLSAWAIAIEPSPICAPQSIILDNGKIHKTEETKNIIKNSGNYLLYTCPYHPRLNCIEQWFNQVKHYMKLSKSNNFNELNSNLKKSINNINKDNYKNYFIYAYNKDLYKTLKRKKLSTKHRTLKIYKN